MTSLNLLSAVEMTRALKAGDITSEELVQDCLNRIDEVDDTVQAWTSLNAEYVLEQAKAADEHRRTGAPVGPLHGVPIGIKDIFDTLDYPTQYGSPLHEGRRTTHDATVVSMLRQAGAIIMGKTVTAEFAVLSPGKTTNPHDATRTPGGSSSGSAAAVSAGMVPLALGTQTNGSVTRPASYCGVVGYKPSFGLISRHRVLRGSAKLDHVGVFARTVEDAALVAEAIIGYDENDVDTVLMPKPDLLAKTSEEPPMPPHFAYIKGPAWSKCSDDTQEAFAELVEALGDQVEEIDLGDVYDEVFDWHRVVMDADIAKNLSDDYERGAKQISPVLSEMIERGRKVPAIDYNLALDRMAMFSKALDPMFAEFDAIITPAATGEAPVGLDSTGDPACATLWTFAGMPSLSLPILQGEAGMPLGVQLVAARGDDARLFRNASWLTQHLETLTGED
ncbi:MAG: amidase [Rhodospirillaceae bacterium]|nr:MAG: amidase [Rhodospirillaceae bacterium]